MFLSNIKRSLKTEMYFKLKRKILNQKKIKKKEQKINPNKNQKLPKNRYEENKNNVKKRWKTRGKSLESRKKSRKENFEREKRSIRPRRSKFQISSLCNISKKRKPWKSKIREVIQEKYKLRDNFLFKKGFKVDNKMTKMKSIFLNQKSFSRDKINLILKNFVLIKSIKEIFCNFEVISSGRFSLSSKAKFIFTNKTFLIKSYEIERLHEEDLGKQFLVRLIKDIYY